MLSTHELEERVRTAVVYERKRIAALLKQTLNKSPQESITDLCNLYGALIEGFSGDDSRP